MPSPAAPLLVLAVAGTGGWVAFRAWTAARRREQANARLEEARVAALPEGASPEIDLALDEGSDTRPFTTRHVYVPWIVTAVLATGLLIWGVRLPFVLASSMILGVLGTLVETTRFERRRSKIETQLSDTIDLMIGSLRAGAGLSEALDTATDEADSPLKHQLEIMTGKIRLGQDPQRALRLLAERVPLESFRLFTLTLSVQWEVGGSLAPTLASVGKTIRDRIELTRRIQSQATQARVSVISVLAISYFVGLLMWRADPDRMENFLATSFGANAVGGSMALQAVGLIWMFKMSQIEH